MSWLKEVIVDIIATVVIILAVLLNHPILTGLIWIYTGLLLFVKFITLVGDGFMNLMSKSKTNAPQWFSHLLYAINTGVLLYFSWWYAGIGWTLIWIISYLTQRQIDNAS